MKDTILFDLDGTLLPMDFDDFMARYFHHMGEHFAGWIDSRLLAKHVLAATEVMIRTNDGRTNEDIFMDHFKTLIDGDLEEYANHFSTYYESGFEHVRAATWQSKDMIAAVRLLQKKGYRLAVATNPLFPYRANLHRLRWAGFGEEDFDYISSFEENTYTKPHPGYFQEVLDQIDRKANQCIMVGNDVDDDLPAMTLGIETFLITDCLINRREKKLNADHVGTYADFLGFVQELPDLTKTT